MSKLLDTLDKELNNALYCKFYHGNNTNIFVLRNQFLKRITASFEEIELTREEFLYPLPLPSDFFSRFDNTRQDQILRFFDILNKLKVMDIKIPHNIIVIFLLLNILRTYEFLKIAFKSQEELPMAEELKIQIGSISTDPKLQKNTLYPDIKFIDFFKTLEDLQRQKNDDILYKANNEIEVNTENILGIILINNIKENINKARSILKIISEECWSDADWGAAWTVKDSTQDTFLIEVAVGCKHTYIHVACKT
ncbi:hypothetical protein V1477_013265 [Vespula maculifrons]|uniref:Uncharacterized protein n=1 Tax=Vespula maculifrons TaxID=7453 RepID=A0ABD2BVG3_VESMC